MSKMLSIFTGLGPALRLLRKEVAALSQVQVAKRTGIAQGRLSRYETGRKLPDTATLDRLLVCYGADLVRLDRALRQARGELIATAPPSYPELKAAVKAVLLELGYPTPEPPRLGAPFDLNVGTLGLEPASSPRLPSFRPEGSDGM